MEILSILSAETLYDLLKCKCIHNELKFYIIPPLDRKDLSFGVPVLFSSCGLGVTWAPLGVVSRVSLLYVLVGVGMNGSIDRNACCAEIKSVLTVSLASLFLQNDNFDRSNISLSEKRGLLVERR